MSGQLVFRPPSPGELAGVVRRWADGFGPKTSEIVTATGPDRYTRVGRFFDTGLSPRLWYRAHELVIAELLGRPKVQVIVAAFGRVPDVLTGWVCLEQDPDGPTIVHFVNVEPSCRRHGIGRALLGHAHAQGGGRPLRFTHMTRAGATLVGSWHKTTSPTIPE